VALKRFVAALSICLVLSHFVFTQKALAYINPGTGSLIFQLIIAAALGGAVFLKMYWNKLIHLFKKTTDEEANEQ